MRGPSADTSCSELQEIQQWLARFARRRPRYVTYELDGTVFDLWTGRLLDLATMELVRREGTGGAG